jgi:CSLREA domain-containing protein
MKSAKISVLAAALLLCLDCAPILAVPIPAPGTGAAAAPNLVTVDTVDDQMGSDGKCSLREAISAANLDAPVDACPTGVGDDIIILPEGHYVLRLAGAGEDDNATGDLDLRSNLTLIGAGSGLTIIDGGGIDRVLDVHADAHLVVNGVTITNGASPDGKLSYSGGGGDAESGGGVRNAGDLWLLGCQVTGNRAGSGGYGEGHGGEAGDGGGIYSQGNLTLQLSEVAQNAAGDGGRFHVSGTPCVGSTQGGEGGGIWNDGTLAGSSITIAANRAGSGFGGGTGGGVWNSGTLTITHATISENLAGVGSGGGGISNAGHLSLSHSTLSANRAGDGNDAGRCLYPGSGGDGGAIYNSGWLSVSNGTLSGNRAGDGGDGLFFVPGEIGPGGSGGGISNAGIAQLEYSTVSVNASGHLGSGYGGADPGGDGGGIVNRGGGLITIKGSLLAGNTAARDGPDCQGSLASQGYNLIQDAGYCSLTGDLVGNIIGQAARLAPLADNGGTTWTHALLSSSPAIDRGDCRSLAGALITTDQRGWPRPMGAACDIGAYEKVPNWYLPFVQR